MAAERILFSPDMYEMVHMQRIKGTDKVRVRRWQAGDWPFPTAAVKGDVRLVSDPLYHKLTAKRIYETLLEEGWIKG